MMTIIREELGGAGSYEVLAPTSATGITVAIREPTSGVFKDLPALAALITVETASIRFTQDGTTPTSTVGHRMDAGQSYTIVGIENVRTFRCIDIAAASSVKITCFF